MIVYQLLVMKLTWECAYGIEVIANTLTYVTTISNIRLYEGGEGLLGGADATLACHSPWSSYFANVNATFCTVMLCLGILGGVHEPRLQDQ